MDTGTYVQLQVAKNIVDDAPLVAGQGVSGSFITADIIPLEITVVNGIVTSIVPA